MGLGVGGTMRQEIYADPHSFEQWSTNSSARCFVHLCNSLLWRQYSGSNPPHPPFTSTEHKSPGIPWFDYYRDDLPAVDGSPILRKAKSIFQLGQEKKLQPLPENNSVAPELIIQHGNARRPLEVRQWPEDSQF